MYQSIKLVLGDSHMMFYHSSWPISKLSPVCGLDQCLRQVNANLHTHGKDTSKWSAADQHELARLLRANWIHTRLGTEPIRKPVLVHRESDRLIVDCGDTRLMALDLCEDQNQTVAVLATDYCQERSRYQGWHTVQDEQQLLCLTGFGQDAEIHIRTGQGSQAISWFEIGDRSTAHHLHDIEQRKNMMRNYLRQQHPDFRFDRSWARSKIDWQAYDQA